NFVPCNGRFPTLITIITMFFVGTGRFSTLTSAMLLALLILFGILMTFFVSFVLSKTILKGVPTSFTLELPPYRKPQIIKVIIRSIFDRTAFVLGRAVVVAIPAGLIIWIMANFNINGVSLLKISTNFLQPFGNLIGLDGVILMAFILGFPANEIVMPIAIMAYMSTGTLTEFNNITDLRILLVNNGWTWITAINTMIFSLMHWPCSTTCLTIKKETQSLKWTMISFFVPTIVGIFTCFIFTSIASLFI
ncbi:MAG: nucleoside recognition domain-containing protein, partial [Anaerotignaceae bacterium]